MAPRKRQQENPSEPLKRYGKVFKYHQTFNSLILEIELDPWTRTMAVLDKDAYSKFLGEESAIWNDRISSDRELGLDWTLNLWAEFEPGDTTESLVLTRFHDNNHPEGKFVPYG